MEYVAGTFNALFLIVSLHPLQKTSPVKNCDSKANLTCFVNQECGRANPEKHTFPAIVFFWILYNTNYNIL